MVRKTTKTLQAENEELRLRLEEAEGALEAIRTGQVDSLVVEGPDGPQIFSLEGASHSYRVLVEAISEGAATLSEDGTILYCNKRFARMLDAPLNQVMGASILTSICASSRPLFADLLREAADGESRGEIALRTRGDKDLLAYLSISAIVDGGRRVFCLVATDLTQQKQELDKILASMSDAVVVLDPSRTVVRANAAAIEKMGFDPVGLERSAVERRLALHWPDGRALTTEEQPTTRALRGETISGLRVVLTGPARRLDFSVSCSPLRVGDRIIGAVGVWHDVTEFERSQKALQESKARLASVLDRSLDCIYRYNIHAQSFDYISPAARLIVGFSPEELKAQDAEAAVSMIHPDDRATMRAALARMEETGEAKAEYRQQTKDGEYRWVSNHMSLTRDESGRPLHRNGTLRDVTERKNAEEALRANEAKYRKLFETIEEMVSVYDVERDDGGRVIERRLREANSAFLRAVGSSSLDAVRGKTSGEIFGKAWSDQHLPAVLKAMETGQVQLQEVYRPETGRHYVTSVIRLDAEAYMGTGWDITERKQAEAALLEADKRKTEFLSMLSHELRNPLAPIRNSVYIVERAAPGGEQAKRALAVIDRQVHHMTRLIEDLLDVTRISRGKIRLQRESIELSALLRRSAEDHRSIFAQNTLELDVRPGDKAIFVDADGTRISQVVGNLLGNAAKFTPPGGKVVLSLEAQGSSAVVRVRDNGAGIAPDLIGKLFLPFVQADRTLDRNKGGLGLGLSLVKGLVELHGGTVTASSDGPGTGAAFEVRLPITKPTAPNLVVAPASIPADLLRILIIEDRVEAADSLKEILEMMDHFVATAGNGRDGVQKARLFKPDLVLCDIGLPELDGYGVARELRADPAFSSTCLVALSGYAMPEDVEKALRAGFDKHIAKPPELRAIEAIILEVVAKRSKEASREGQLA